MKYKYCGNCQFLNITEQEQNRFKGNAINHRCTLFNKRVVHTCTDKFNDDIIRLDKCIKLKIKDTKIIDNFLDFLEKYIDLNNQELEQEE